MSYRTILSLAAATVLSAACISTISTDAFARGGARVGGHHGAVAHRGVHRGTYAHRGDEELMPTVEFIAERRWALAQLQ